MARTKRAAPLDIRTLNRTLLERQMLLGRRRAPALRTIEHLVTMQAQVPRDPYVALWSRIEGFDAQTLSRAIRERRAVRLTLLRGTLHLATVADAVAIRPVIQPAIEGTLFGSSPLRRAVASVDLDELLGFFREQLEATPLSRAELVRRLAERWPDRDADSLGYAMYLLPTVQVTPRGLWGESGRSAFTTLERWTGRAAGSDPAPDGLVMRYLKAFGPATPADVQAWCGLRGMRDVLERLRPRLRTFRGDDGRELFDVPRAPIGEADAPVPVRFLPEYDNVVLAHKDRSRIAGPGTSIWTEVGWGLVLVDGFTSARWKVPRDSGVMEVETFRSLTPVERGEVEAEGRRLVGFLSPESAPTDVRIRRMA